MGRNIRGSPKSVAPPITCHRSLHEVCSHRDVRRPGGTASAKDATAPALRRGGCAPQGVVGDEGHTMTKDGSQSAAANWDVEPESKRVAASLRGLGLRVPTSQVRGSRASSAALIGIIVVLNGSSVGCSRAPGLVELGHYCSLTTLSLSLSHPFIRCFTFSPLLPSLPWHPHPSSFPLLFPLLSVCSSSRWRRSQEELRDIKMVITYNFIKAQTVSAALKCLGLAL